MYAPIEAIVDAKPPGRGRSGDLLSSVVRRLWWGGGLDGGEVTSFLMYCAISFSTVNLSIAS